MATEKLGKSAEAAAKAAKDGKGPLSSGSALEAATHYPPGVGLRLPGDGDVRTPERRRLLELRRPSRGRRPHRRRCQNEQERPRDGSRAAAAAARIVPRTGSRRRRGCRVDIP